MKTRNLSKLTETKEFQKLINDYPIKYAINDGNIILSNNSIYIHIYSYMTEDIPYFHIFDISDKTYCFDVNRIISDILNNDILKIYDFYKNNYNISTLNEGIYGEITVEIYFLIKIKIIKEYLADLLYGKIDKYKKYFEPLIGGYINMFDELKLFVENNETKSIDLENYSSISSKL